MINPPNIYYYKSNKKITIYIYPSIPLNAMYMNEIR
jgi:hypothetical protein